MADLLPWIDERNRNKLIDALQRSQSCLSLLELRLRGHPESLNLLERLQKALAITKSAKVPMLLDDAAGIPPIGNLTLYARMGIDLFCFSGGMPMPRSSTEITAESVSCLSVRRIGPPSGLNFAALTSRLEMTRSMRGPSTVAGSSASRSNGSWPWHASTPAWTRCGRARWTSRLWQGSAPTWSARWRRRAT